GVDTGKTVLLREEPETLSCQPQGSRRHLRADDCYDRQRSSLTFSFHPSHEEHSMGALSGKAAVVTGAGRGIGKGHALQLAKAGASIVVNDIDKAVAEEVVAEITKLGGKAIANADSVGTKAGADAMVKACVDAFGSIDIMIANAGIARDRTFLKMSEEEF